MDEPWTRIRDDTAIGFVFYGCTEIVGDVCFDEAREVAAVLTPVPGGVGPLTVAILMRSAAAATRKQLRLAHA